MSNLIIRRKAREKYRYDRTALKFQYFTSDIDNLTEFLEGTIGKRNGNFNKQTKGWFKDKMEWRKSIIEKAAQKTAERVAKELEIPMERMMIMKNSAIALLNNKLGAVDKLIRGEDGKIIPERLALVNVKDVVKTYEVAKIELKEPTKITQNFNLTKKEEELTEEDEKLLDELYNNNDGGNNRKNKKR